MYSKHGVKVEEMNSKQEDVLTVEAFLDRSSFHQYWSDFFHLLFCRLSTTSINIFTRDFSERHVCTLEDIQYTSHVATRQLDERFSTILTSFHTFFLDDKVESRKYQFWSQWSKTEPCASRLYGRNYLGQVVTNDTESGLSSVLFDNWKTESVNRSQGMESNSLRRRAFWASLVIASASSRMINLNVLLNTGRASAKFWISLRTIPIPRSSDAFN